MIDAPTELQQTPSPTPGILIPGLPPYLLDFTFPSPTRDAKFCVSVAFPKASVDILRSGKNSRREILAQGELVHLSEFHFPKPISCDRRQRDNHLNNENHSTILHFV
jgi:hypothetical protein